MDAIKGAPMCEETILWFEFLLKPEMLEEYLKKDNSQQRSIDILSEFLGIGPSENSQQVNEISSPDSDSLNKLESLSLKLGRKQLALKILSLKVASFLNFNLNTFEKSLPVQKQIQLLSDLCSISSGRLVNLPLSLVHEVPLSQEGNKSALNFALTLYHRWLLRAHVLKGASKAKPYVHIMPGPDQPIICSNPDDKFFAGIEPFTPTSIEFLNQIIADPEPFRMLTFESFVPLEENSGNKADGHNGQKFDRSIIISKTELMAQIYFDLCAYNIFIKKYDVGRQMIILCRDNLKKLKEEFAGRQSEVRFCTVTDEELNGYLSACGIFEQEPVSLFQRFNESILNKNKDLDQILNEDNVKREIPFIHRKTLEIDNDQSSSEGLKLLALNNIRYILDDTNILTSDTTSLRFKDKDQRTEFLANVVQVR